MKKELYIHFLYINSLFNTTELKITANDCLEINKLSMNGNLKQTIDLKNKDIGIKYYSSKKIYSSTIALLLLAGSLFIFLFHNIFSKELGFSFFSIGILAVITSFVLYAFKARANKKLCIYNLSSNKDIYTISFEPESNNNEIEAFIDDLNDILAKNNQKNALLISNYPDKDDILNQYNDLIFHLENLYNYGVIDDNTFNRIELNINQKLYPTENNEKQPVADVIFLYNY